MIPSVKMHETMPVREDGHGWIAHAGIIYAVEATLARTLIDAGKAHEASLAEMDQQLAGAV
jgi:hypothetical protein